MLKQQPSLGFKCLRHTLKVEWGFATKYDSNPKILSRHTIVQYTINNNIGKQFLCTQQDNNIGPILLLLLLIIIIIIIIDQNTQS